MNRIPQAPDMYREPLDWIATQHNHMLHLTESWARINSGSTHIEGLSRMAKVLEDNFYWLGVPVERHALAPMRVVSDAGEASEQRLGEVLRLRKRPDAPIRVLLVGHYDTVYGKDHPFQEPYYTEDGKLHGPGVADLKGGLVVMLKALEALEKSPFAAQVGWEVVLNPDEEIGSVGSDPFLQEAARRAQLGLVFEPALPDGTLAGARKGSGNFTLVIKGKAAHAGRNPEEGRNALVAASQVAAALMALNGKRLGLSVNPARMVAGGALNVVPDLATLKWNIRIAAPEDEAWVLAQIQKIIAGFQGVNGYEAVLSGHFTRAPKPMCERNTALFHWVADTGRMLGQAIAWKDTGGACDGNNLYKHGLANVDTLGVRGGLIHSEGEYMEMASSVERAQLAALLLMRLGAGEIPEKALKL